MWRRFCPHQSATLVIGCRVKHGGQLTDALGVRTGVRQGGMLALTVFVPPGNRLGHEAIHRRKTKWHTVDHVDTAG